MRLRIRTASPLPEVRAWFIPETQETVFVLKKLLCKGIPQLKAIQIHAQNLTLLLDGFELLNDSPMSAVRDGDLIVVKMAQPSQSRKRKRGGSNEFDTSSKKKIARGAPESDEESSSASESTTSESSSSSAVSLEGSTSSKPPPTIPKTPQLRKLAKEPLKQPPKTPHVPPGQGKPSTHLRNQRRKKKRESNKADQLKGLPEANKLPLGSGQAQNITDLSAGPLSASLQQSSKEPSMQGITSTPHETSIVDPSAPPSSSKYVYITPDQVMMGSLRNKNKKKGFKQSMTGPIPRKIVFDEAEQTQLSEPNPASDDHTVQISADPQYSRANESSRRLIPPSELQVSGQLPPNVFVTSVDVEEHMWASTDGVPKRSRSKRKRVSYDEDDKGYIEELPYGAQAEGAATLAISNDFDWDKAEKLWEASSPVQDIHQLSDGVVFGWKNLALNPQTFTPERLLILTRLTRVVPEGINIVGDPVEARIYFRRIRRPGASEAAVAFGVAPVDDESDVEEDDEEEEYVGWSDVLRFDWRIVDM